MIDKDIEYIEFLTSDLIKELKEFDKSVKTYYPDDEYAYTYPNKHKASFNRLRLELNKKLLDLSKKFKWDYIK